MTVYLSGTGIRGDYADTAGPVVTRMFPGGAAATYSVVLFMRMVDEIPVGGVVFAVEKAGSDTPFLKLVSAGGGSFGWRRKGAVENAAGVSCPADGNWHQVAMTVNAEIPFLTYDDGALDDNAAGEEEFDAADTLTLFDDSTHTNPAKCDVAGLAFFAYDLTPTEIADIYAQAVSYGPDADPTNVTDSGAANLWLVVGAAPAGGVAPDVGVSADSPLTVHTWSARAIPVGTHSIRVLSTLLDDADVPFEGWAFAFVDADNAATFGEAPRVTGTVGTRSDLAVELDAAMHPGIAYTLTPPEGDDFAITGPRRSLSRERSPDDRVLLDIDAPFIRPEGAGGDYTIGASGDYSLSGGLATVEKAIWDTVLSTKGERYWDPGRGTDLRHKQLRPLDTRADQRALEAQIEAIPYVRAAVVQLLWNTARMMVITIRAQTDFGRLETSREVEGG